MASDVAKSLHEQEMRLYEQVKVLAKTAADENRNFTTDEQAKWSDIHAELDAVDKRLKDVLDIEKRAKATDDAYNEFAGRRADPAMTRAASGLEEEVRAFVNGEKRHLDISAGRGRLSQRLQAGYPTTPHEARDLTSPYINPGSFSNQTNAGIVPIDFYDQLMSYLVEVSGIMQTGPSVLNTQGGEPIQIPQVAMHTGYVSASSNFGGQAGNEGQVFLSAGQTSALATADPKFTQTTLTANKFGILVKVARELLDDSGVNLLGYLAMSAGRAIGNNLGYSLVNGGQGITQGLLGGNNGVAVSVTGSAGSAGIASTGVAPWSPQYKDLVKMQYKVIAPYRQSKSCYWFAADQTVGDLRMLTDTTGRPLWEPSTVLGSPDLILGKPVVADPFMPVASSATPTTLVFGDFAQYFVRLVGGVRFERSDDYAFNTDEVAFRAVIRADGNLNYLANTPPPLVGFQAA